MGIEEWANNPEIMGNFLKFPDNGVLEFVFLNDGVVQTIKRGDEEEYQVVFDVERDNAQWKFGTSSKRLLKALKEVAEKNGNSLIGLHVRITKVGDKFNTYYTVDVLNPQQ